MLKKVAYIERVKIVLLTTKLMRLTASEKKGFTFAVDRPPHDSSSAVQKHEA